MKRAILLAAAVYLMTSGTVYAKTASASLQGLGSSTWTSGTVNFTEENGGLKITGDVKSVNPGKHGFHIHENGSCDNNGSAAGNHFNPSETQHGILTRDGLEKAHAGDLGNFEVGSDGTGKYEAFVPGLSLSEGPNNIMGRSVVLHEKEDDGATQPSGNSAARIACGVIN